MKKFAGLLIAAVVAAGVLGGCKPADKAKELNLYTWAEYVPSAVIDDFTAKTGIKVNYSVFNDNDEAFAKLQAQKGVYDVIICTDYIIDSMIKEGGMIQKLDKSKLPNFKNINPNFQGLYYDPLSEYSIPYSIAAPVIAYDSAKVTDKIEGYGDLWNPNFKNEIALLNSARDNVGMTLMSMGKSFNETDPAVLLEARGKLLALKPNVSAFGTSTPDVALISGEATIGIMFGSQAQAALDAIPTIKVVYPSEGQCVFIDNIVLADNAPNKDNALEFLNYLMDGEVSAKATMIINYPGANSAAMQYFTQEFLDNEIVNIPAEKFENSQSYQEIGDAMLIYDEIWTEFMSN